MEFKYACSLLFSNMGHTLKILVWGIISVLITFGIGCAIYIPLWGVLETTTNAANTLMALKDSFSMYFNGDINFFATIHIAVSDLHTAFYEIGSNIGLSFGLTIGGIFLYALYGFLMSLSFYPMADIINNKMSSNMNFGFVSNFVMNLKKSFKYAAARITITLPLDLICFVIIACCIFGLFPLIKLFAFTIALLFAILYIAGRTTLLAGWLPRMLYYSEEKVYVNFARSLTSVKHNLAALFKTFMFTFTIVYICVMIFVLPTFGLMSIIMPPIYYFLIRSVELISYYKMNRMSFYIDANIVIDTVEFGYRKINQGE